MTREALIKHWDVIQAFKEGKEIQYYDTVDKCWYIAYEPSFRLDMILRIKPEQTKRLPTIEEVEQWFLENKVFMSKHPSYGLYRIESLRDDGTLRIGLISIDVDKFCEDFLHYDGTELYITEN